MATRDSKINNDSENIMLEKLIQQTELTHFWSQHIEPSPYSSLQNPALSEELMQRAVNAVTQWPGYTPTDIHALTPVAKACGVRAVFYKDESARFGLGSFKALGGAFAILDWAASTLTEQLGKPVSIESVRSGEYKEQMKNLTVATATDGNHGRSVAWGAQLAGCPCEIFIHRDVSVGREQAMAEFGANVTRIDGDYDESVRVCATQSANNDWQIISDTSWPGYNAIPRAVMAGYTVMVEEMASQMDTSPTHVIVQAGVGGLAAGVMSAWWKTLGENAPKFIVVESDRAACIYQSLDANAVTAVRIAEETVMAGLSCGEVSELAWPVLQQGVTAAVCIADDLVPLAMQCFANAQVTDKAIEAGECAVPGVIALAGIMKNEKLRQQCGLDETSVVQIFGCEGATDRAVYDELLAQPT